MVSRADSPIYMGLGDLVSLSADAEALVTMGFLGDHHCRDLLALNVAHGSICPFSVSSY
jgi:hypothetical protein